jgi:hypothetical protein
VTIIEIGKIQALHDFAQNYAVRVSEIIRKGDSRVGRAKQKPPRGQAWRLIARLSCVIGSAALLIVKDCLRCGFGHFNLGAHLLNLRRLLFHRCCESLNFLSLLRDRSLEIIR